MGEIADMMLDGTLCQVCGVYMGEGDGFPVTCRACSDGDEEPEMEKPKKKKHPCPICGARKVNVSAHIKAVHTEEDKSDTPD